MKIDYTLPGLLPPAVATPSSSEATGLTFRGRLSLLRPQPRIDWRQLLRLDRPPADATIIGPPPRPPGLDPKDAAAQRAAWSRLLHRHSDLLGLQNGAGGRMMALLLNMHDLERAVAARQLSAAQE